MLIGVLKEIKNYEYCVGFMLVGVCEFMWYGYCVLVQCGVGMVIGLFDDDYMVVGVLFSDGVEDIFVCVDMIIKVKELQLVECVMLWCGQIFYIYLYFVFDFDQVVVFVKFGVVCIVYEIVMGFGGGLLLFVLMSEVVGCMLIQVVVIYFESLCGGCGLLMVGVLGVLVVYVVVFGVGVVGIGVLQMVVGFGVCVIVFDNNVNWLCQFDFVFVNWIVIVCLNVQMVDEVVCDVDVVIGVVFVFGVLVLWFVMCDMIVMMCKGVVVVDVVIDQGGCFEILYVIMYVVLIFVVDGVVYYCVVNMFGVVVCMFIFVLNNVMFGYVFVFVDKGWKQVMFDDLYLCVGLNVCDGYIMYEVVVLVFGLFYVFVIGVFG